MLDRRGSRKPRPGLKLLCYLGHKFAFLTMSVEKGSGRYDWYRWWGSWFVNGR